MLSSSHCVHTRFSLCSLACTPRTSWCPLSSVSSPYEKMLSLAVLLGNLPVSYHCFVIVDICLFSWGVAKNLILKIYVTIISSNKNHEKIMKLSENLYLFPSCCCDKTSWQDNVQKSFLSCPFRRGGMTTEAGSWGLPSFTLSTKPRERTGTDSSL